ncbi:MAG: outer membrane protein assembly factor BamA, partial [Spirochaetaceae bacterium]|nr:outer membrane protein assembly factor BamA [Spirochaetaceae bacterium]
MRRFTILLVLTLLVPFVLFAQNNSQDDQWYLEKPIADIRFEGLSSVSKNELLGLTRPYLGQNYTDSLSWDIQSKLYALDYFDIIIPKIIPGDSASESLILVFQIQEKPQVNEVLFSGNSKVRRGELTDTVLIKSGDLLNPGSLKIDELAIIDYYLEKGFIEALAVAEYTVDEKTNEATIIFNITEGNQTKISDIRFVGNDKHVSDNTLQNLMKTKAQSLFNKGLFVETKLQEDLKSIERYYGDQGF